MYQNTVFHLTTHGQRPKRTQKQKPSRKNDIFEAWALEELSGNYLSDIRGDFEKYNL